MEQIFTDEEIRVMYQEKQREPFPARKNIMGIMLAAIFILGTIGAWIGLLWVLKIIFKA